MRSAPDCLDRVTIVVTVLDVGCVYAWDVSQSIVLHVATGAATLSTVSTKWGNGMN